MWRCENRPKYNTKGRRLKQTPTPLKLFKSFYQQAEIMPFLSSIRCTAARTAYFNPTGRSTALLHGEFQE